MYRDGVVLLFHITASGIPEALIEVLAHPKIFKVGLNIGGDARKLMKDFEFLNGKIHGVVEVRKFATFLGVPPASSLSGMVEQLLHKRLPKPSNIRCGNWDQVPLSAASRHYAALDAYASFAVMKAAFEKHLSTVAQPKDLSEYTLEILENVSSMQKAQELRTKCDQSSCPVEDPVRCNGAVLSHVGTVEYPFCCPVCLLSSTN